jgi:hypothetical protein
MFKMHNLPPVKGQFISIEKACELLFRHKSSPLETTIVDKPIDGTLFIFHGSMGNDGYGWMDDPQVTKTTLDTVEIEINSKRMGFASLDSTSLMYYLLTKNAQGLYYCL